MSPEDKQALADKLHARRDDITGDYLFDCPECGRPVRIPKDTVTTDWDAYRNIHWEDEGRVDVSPGIPLRMHRRCHIIDAWPHRYATVLPGWTRHEITGEWTHPVRYSYIWLPVR